MQAKLIKEKALELGFSACGIIPAKPFEEYKRALDERVAAYPEAEEDYKPLYSMHRPPKAGKSIIVCAAGINHYKMPSNLAKYIGKMYLFDERFHYTKGYRAQQEFEAFLKNTGLRLIEGGIPDRWAAAKAGIGKFGLNNFIYTPENGSYVIVLTWIVDAVLEYDAVQKDVVAEQCSEKCLLCVKACPTKAMSGSLMMNRQRCAAQMSFSPDNYPEDAESWEQMGCWLYGCDACQDVCPMNKGKMKGTEEFPLLYQHEEYMKPEILLEMDEETFLRVVQARFFYIGKDKQWLWKCNALRTMINEGDAKYHPLIKKYANHEDKRLGDLAKWGIEKLGL